MATPKIVCAVAYKVLLFAPTVHSGTAPARLLPLAEKHPGDDGTEAEVDQRQNEIPATFESRPAAPAGACRYSARHVAGHQTCSNEQVRYCDGQSSASE